MLTLFLDANVFFAATLSEQGGSAALFALPQKKRLRLVSSLYALKEAKRNIVHKVGSNVLPRFFELVSFLENVDSEDCDFEELQRWEAWIVEKDAPILASASRQKVDVLVTLDRKDFQSVRMKKAPVTFKIQSPGEFLIDL
jgi:predicted nucleic acid-binding protein